MRYLQVGPCGQQRFLRRSPGRATIGAAAPKEARSSRTARGGRMAARHLLMLSMVAAALGACEAQRTDGAAARANAAPSGTPTVVRLRAPADSEIPAGPLGASIRRGRA